MSDMWIRLSISPLSPFGLQANTGGGHARQNPPCCHRRPRSGSRGRPKPPRLAAARLRASVSFQSWGCADLAQRRDDEGSVHRPAVACLGQIYQVAKEAQAGSPAVTWMQ